MIKYIMLVLLFSNAVMAEEYRVLFLKGSAKIFTLDKKSQFQESKLSLKQTFQTPFRIETGPKSLVLIKSLTKTSKIDQNSKIDFMESEEDSVVDVKYGSFLSNFINPKKTGDSKLRIKSRTASMGVRGTTFLFYQDTKGEKNFLAVNEGVVEYRGENSKNDVEVSMNHSVTINEKLQNLGPGEYEFQKYINWNLNESSTDLSQPAKLYSSFEKVWKQYKKEQEYLWQNRNKDMNEKWKSMSKNE